METEKILVIGACGQMGAHLMDTLAKKDNQSSVVGADSAFLDTHPNLIHLDVLKYKQLYKVVKNGKFTQVYLLSAHRGENNFCANIEALLNVLKVAISFPGIKIFWPSSMAVFGPGSPKHQVPQNHFHEPVSPLGIYKTIGEYWCQYYYEQHGVDVRSIRFPGMIGWELRPENRACAYVIEMVAHALTGDRYTCYLREDTCLPMIYKNDAVRAILELMAAPGKNLKIRTAYNISGTNFSPCDLAAAIRKVKNNFSVSYEPDFRQTMASQQPASINDTTANRDWGWEPQYNLSMMVDDIFQQQRLQQAYELQIANRDIPEDNYVFTNYEYQ
jgi:nucleoside-diphosphate-sugar epimerase